MTARGGTLLELVVAIALLSLVLGMSGVALASLRPPRDSEIVRQLRTARGQAIRNGLPVVTTLGPNPDSLVPVLFLPDGRVIGPGLDVLTGTRHAHP